MNKKAKEEKKQIRRIYKGYRKSEEFKKTKKKFNSVFIRTWLLYWIGSASGTAIVIGEITNNITKGYIIAIILAVFALIIMDTFYREIP